MKNITLSIIVVVLLGLGLWWITTQTTPQDATSPSPTISVSESPSPSSSTLITPATPNITITSPKANESVDSPVTITGKARVFENQFTVQVKNSTGQIVYKQTGVMSDAKNSGLFGNYSVKVPIPAEQGANFKVEVFNLSPKGDGKYEGYASVMIKLKTTDTSSVYAAFITGDDCTTVTLFPRIIIKSPEFVYMSLVELLKGPTTEEKAHGATTQIADTAKINSFRMQGDTAYADFNSALQPSVGGSCRIQAIRSQIENTLKQFFGLKNVVISINGKTAGVLQP